ncbi:YiaA/YiaB family inner membrane protein [Prauserella oleivorans]|uniref:YiaA/YiaB family inner membrane protein n=1 Tax=Prauserella oleivorans TaxID=1478153 RepID=A0ABW5WHU3_9PSEU
MTNSGKISSPTTSAFFVQAAVSFGLALVSVVVGVVYLPVDGWVRAFLALGVLYTVTSTFTLAKCVRDRQEDTYLVSRVDQARLEKLLAEHDPFKVAA